MDKINAKDKPEYFADIVKEQLEMKMEQYDHTLQHVKSSLEETRTKTLEVRDKEHRMKNIIIYRATEPMAERFDDRQRADKTFCIRHLKEALDTEW